VLLQQQLWVGCCTSEMRSMLHRLVTQEKRGALSSSFPIAAAVVELYRMAQCAMAVWSDVLLLPMLTAGTAPLQQTAAAAATHVAQKQQQQQQVSLHAAAMCRLMLSAVTGMQQQFLSDLLDGWDLQLQLSLSNSHLPEPLVTASSGGGSSQVLPGHRQQQQTQSSSSSSCGLLLTAELAVLCNSLLMMRLEQQRIEATLYKVSVCMRSFLGTGQLPEPVFPFFLSFPSAGCRSRMILLPHCHLESQLPAAGQCRACLTFQNHSCPCHLQN